MTKEQHLRLNKYEQVFRTAIDSNYYRAMDSRFAADFIQVCRELSIFVKPTCPACVLNALKTLGRLYFEYVPEKQNEPEIEFPVEEPKEKDDKTIKPEKKVSQSTSKNKKK